MIIMALGNPQTINSATVWLHWTATSLQIVTSCLALGQDMFYETLLQQGHAAIQSECLLLLLIAAVFLILHHHHRYRQSIYRWNVPIKVASLNIRIYAIYTANLPPILPILILNFHHIILMNSGSQPSPIIISEHNFSINALLQFAPFSC